MILAPDDMAVLLAAFAESGLGELHLTGPATDIHLMRRGGSQAPAPILTQHTAAIVAPGVGIFLSRHPLQTEKLTSPGRRVRAREVVALLRIGVLLRQVVTPGDGIIGACLVEEDAMVGYGTALFPFHPDPTEAEP